MTLLVGEGQISQVNLQCVSCNATNDHDDSVKDVQAHHFIRRHAPVRHGLVGVRNRSRWRDKGLLWRDYVHDRNEVQCGTDRGAGKIADGVILSLGSTSTLGRRSAFFDGTTLENCIVKNLSKRGLSQASNGAEMAMD